MDLHLEGKVIIITGGFKGIGKGITLQLAQEGAIPVVINRPGQRSRRVQEGYRAVHHHL